MNKRYFSIAATVAIILSVANMLVLIRSNVGASRLSATNVPQLISYQGRLTDPSTGEPVPDATYDIRFCLYTGPTGGSALWCEDQTVPVTDGVFSVLLGSLMSIPETVFDGTECYLGVKVEADAEMTPRRRVVSVGYAYRAEAAVDADTVDGLHASDFASANHTHSGVPMMKTGTYTGNSQATQAITGVGFRPRALIVYVQENRQTGLLLKTDQDGPYAHVNTDDGNGPIYCENEIISLDADGFTVCGGTPCGRQAPNQAGVTYTYIAYTF